MHEFANAGASQTSGSGHDDYGTRQLYAEVSKRSLSIRSGLGGGGSSDEYDSSDDSDDDSDDDNDLPIMLQRKLSSGLSSSVTPLRRKNSRDSAGPPGVSRRPSRFSSVASVATIGEDDAYEDDKVPDYLSSDEDEGFVTDDDDDDDDQEDGEIYGPQNMSMMSFYEKHATGQYQHGDVTEQATLDYEGICTELSQMEQRLENGEIRRSYEVAEHVMKNHRYWTAVPGFGPKQFALAQDDKVHKSYLPWLRECFANLPRLKELRTDIASFVASKGDVVSENDVKEWVLRTMFRLFAGKTLDDVELKDFKELQKQVFEFIMQSPNEPTSKDLLNQKQRHLRELMDRLGIDDDKASAVLDMLVFAGTNFANTLHVSIAVLFCRNKFFDGSTFELNEENVQQFVWECLRRFPPQAAVGWRQNADNVRHVAVIGMTGRDQTLWGDDVDTIRPNRCPVQEFSAKSCFFAERAGNYACPAKTFALEATSAFLLELVKAGPWVGPKNVQTFPALPYFAPFKITRLPRVIVVGGGVSGLTCALKLAQRGMRVTVVERNTGLGGHARHTDYLGGHLRNPAFGAFVDPIYPNAVALAELLGVEKVPVCQAADFRQNLAMDGHSLPEADPKEIGRFCSQMRAVHKGKKDIAEQTIGDFLRTNNYDHDFVCRFIAGKAIHYFAGLSVGQYLEIPLDLFAWFVVSDMENAGRDQVYRFRNKDYMEAFASALGAHGVDILTGIAPTLVSRDQLGVQVSVDGQVISADKMVLAMPPNAAAEFLGTYLAESEELLTDFDCPLETVVLHQDSRWATGDTEGLFGMFPNKGERLPFVEETIPMTTMVRSGTS